MGRGRGGPAKEGRLSRQIIIIRNNQIVSRIFNVRLITFIKVGSYIYSKL